MDWINDPQAWIGFGTLVALEIVLGIDNIVFISILAGKLPREQQSRARQVGLGLAMFMRIALLFSLSWIVRLTAPLFTVLGQAISGRDLVLLIGGLFLIGKSTQEIHHRLEVVHALRHLPRVQHTKLRPCPVVERRPLPHLRRRIERSAPERREGPAPPTVVAPPHLGG